ncbi:MAG: hypothetical protein K0R65_2740 [Crocinitomicaceae bacterium]|jgi:hypothetical protein|nr:hypothetical protein [Crocinitomicaceae bacterium]
MKRILFLLSFFYAFQFQAQEVDWYRVNPPIEALPSSNYKYQVDDLGIMYCIFGYGDTLRVSQYDALAQTWNVISNETLTASADKIKVDQKGGIIYFTFISEQFPTPLVNMYTIENGAVNLKFREYHPSFYSYGQYDFKVSGLDEYYWFMPHSNGNDFMLSSWNSGTGDIDSYIIPQYSGTYITNLQMQQLNDTLWFCGGGNPLQKLQLIKTHKDAVNFLTYDGSANGYFMTGGGNYLLANRTNMLSNRIDKLTLASVESNNNKVDFTLTYGVVSANPIAGSYFPTPMGAAITSNNDDKAYILGNFSPLGDSTNHRAMVLAKNYSANNWDTVGSPSTQILRSNNQYVMNTSLSHNPLSRRFVAAFDSVGYSKQLRVLNAFPDPDSTLTVLQNTLCVNPTSSPNSLFSDFSLWDPNHDMLEIIAVNSSDASVIAGADVSYTSGYFVGQRVAFDVFYQNASLGTATLDFFVTDGYDTIVVSENVTFSNYAINFTTDGNHCGPGQPTVSADLTNGNIDWYDSPAGGTYLGSGATLTTPHITSTTVYYAEGLDNNCVTGRMSVNAIINAIPSVDAGLDQTLCDGASLTLNATGTAGAIFSWDNGVTDGVSFVPPVGWTPYTVTATDPNGCTNTDDIEITVHALPSVDAGFDQTICFGDNVVIHGDGAFTYSWDNGVTDSIPFSPTVTKTYHVTGTDINGCMNTDSVVVTVNPAPTVSAGTDQTICDGSGVTLSGSGADFYSWDNGVADGNMFFPTSTALYAVTGTDLNGCSSNDTVLVTVLALPTIDAGIDQTACENTTVTLSASGGTGYSWDNGVTDGVPFTPAGTGITTYTVTGTNANGCQNTDMVDVTVNGLPAVDAGFDQTICFGDNVVIHGDGAATYSWDNGVTDSIPFSPAATATYHVTGTDINGCVNTDSVVVTVNALPAVNGGSDQSVCDGTSITLSGSGADSYSWDHGVSDGFSFVPGATDVYVVTGYDLNGCFATDSVNVTVLALPVVDAGFDQSVCDGSPVTLSALGANSYSWDNGITDGVSFMQPVGIVTYTVTGTDANGCENTDQVDVTVNSMPAIDAGSDQTICQGSDVTLSGSGGVSYIWDNGVIDGAIFNPTATLTYTVTGTDGNGCSGSDAVTVTVNTLPVINAGSDQTVCENNDVVLNGNGGISYLWDNGVFDGVIFNPASTALYAVTGYDANGCSANDTVLITVNPLPIVDAGADLTVCENTLVMLTASGADSYVWNNGVTDGVAFTALAATYTVTGTDLNGCENTDQVDINVNALPMVDAGPDQSACENTSFVLNGSGADSYSWDNGVTDGLSFIPPVGVTTYSVTGTDANGCENTDDITLTVFSLPTINATPAVEICQEEELTLNASSSASIVLWYTQSSGGTPIFNGTDLQLFSLMADATYYVEAFENGCTSARIPVDITVNPKPLASLTSTNSNCGTSNGTADATISSGTAPFTYYWSSGEQQTLSVSNLGTGSYYFNVEDSKGCKAIAVTEIIPTGIAITPTIINPTCAGATNGSINLNVSGISEDLVYLWSTGHHTTNLTNMGAGTYEVTITSESGCVLTSTFTLTEPAVIMNAVSEQRPTCGDNDGQLSVTATTGGTGPYFYSWSNGQTGMNNVNLTYGSYILTTSDQAGCQVQNTYYLSESGAPLIRGAVTETTCGNPNGAIDLDITPGPGDAIASISWSNAATTEDISNLTPGSYTCFLNTTNNCTAVNAWTVNVAKPMTQEICIVSVDSVTTSNIVVWEKVQTSGISHYNIYRETNQVDEYLLIDTVQFSNLSVFNDVVASPMSRSWRYRISAVNACGVEGELSQPNKTLHLNIFDLGTSGVEITWDEYEGNAFSNYILWRYTELNGWEDIATLGTSTLNYTDGTATYTESGLDYMVEIALDEACTATTWRAQDFNRSRSNKEKGFFKAGEGTGDYSNNGLVEFEQDNISLNVYPNPFNESINIDLQGTDELDLHIYNIQNQLVKSTSCKSGVSNLDLAELSKGVYYIQVNNKLESKIIRIVKN